MLNPNETSAASSSADLAKPVSSSYLPLKHSGKDYSLGLIDRSILKRLRHWLESQFRNEFAYEPNSLLSLAKVRDQLSQPMILGSKN